MSISYSGIIGNKSKGALPSVESWGTNNNILRDPPKSITTRRIDKVNADGSLNEMMYHSGDRFAENINVYARGVNPSVSVEFGNVGSFTANSGKGLGAFGNGAPGKLPYRILTDGAFRPPILRMEQLMPLSRQPRLVTQCFTNQQFVDYSKTVQCSNPSRQVHDTIIHPSARPTRTIKFQEPVREHFELKYVIENPLRSNVLTNRSAKANLDTQNQEPIRQAQKDVSHYALSSGVKGNAQFQNYIHSDMELAKNVPNYSLNAGVKGNAQFQNYIHSEMELDKNVPNYSTNAGVKGNAQFQNYIHSDMELEKNVPTYSTKTAKSSTFKTNIQSEHDMVLQRNMPSHMNVTNKQVNFYTRLDDNTEMVLERNLPEYNMFSSMSDKRVHVDVHADTDYNFTQKVGAGNVATSKSANANLENNRNVHLPDTLEVGGFDSKGSMHRDDLESVRTYNNAKFSTQKSMLADFAQKSLAQKRNQRVV